MGRWECCWGQVGPLDVPSNLLLLPDFSHTTPVWLVTVPLGMCNYVL